MTVFKGIIVYGLVFLGLILGVGIILIGVMYLFPQVSVFGYKFYHGNSAGAIYEVMPGDEFSNNGNVLLRDKNVLNDVDAIEIQTNKWDVNINYYEGHEDNDDSKFRVEFTRAITGFVSVKTPKPMFEVQATRKALTGQSEEKNVVTFKVIEPKGAYFNRNASITIWIPDTTGNGSLDDLYVQSGGGKVNFAQVSVAELVPVGNPELNVKNLTIKDSSGVFNLSHTNVTESLNISSNDAKFSVDRDLDCNLNLNCKKGKYQFKNIKNAQNQAEVKVDAVNGDVIFDTVEGNLTLKTDYGFFRANEIKGNFSSLSHNVSDYNNACDIRIQKILGYTIIQNDSGKIELGQVGEIGKQSAPVDLKVDTKSGDVTIKYCFSKNIAITSKSGVIRLSNCLGAIDATTTYGSVYVDFMTKNFAYNGVDSTTISDAVENLKTKTTKIVTGCGKGNGAIEVANSLGVLNLDSKGSGKVTATMLNVVGDNSIRASNGNATVIVPEDSKFWCKWKASKSASIYVVAFESNEKTYNKDMQNYNQTLDAVFMGGLKDATIKTKLSIECGKDLKFYSAYHSNLI